MRKIGRPSPAMVVALIALVFAMTGSAAAVVSFARNAGAVDGKSATSSGASNGFASGKLVALRKSGLLRGTLPSKFLDPTTVARDFVFGRNAEVIDNGSETPFTIATIPGFGTVTATCGDENNNAGNENPKTTITFGNTSGQNIEFARSTGSGGALGVVNLANNQASSFTINVVEHVHAAGAEAGDEPDRLRRRAPERPGHEQRQLHQLRARVAARLAPTAAPAGGHDDRREPLAGVQLVPGAHPHAIATGTPPHPGARGPGAGVAEEAPPPTSHRNTRRP